MGPSLVGGPLVGYVDSSAGTGIGLLKYPLVQVTYLKPFQISKERTTGSGYFKNFKGTARCHEGPGKEPADLCGYLIWIDNPVHHNKEGGWFDTGIHGCHKLECNVGSYYK